MEKEKACIGVDVGGTYIRVGILKGSDTPLCFEKIPQGSVFKGRCPPKQLSAFLRDYMHRNGLTADNTGACAVGMPSSIDQSKRRVLSTPNIPAFENVDLADLLERQLEIPVFLDRDVNMIYRHDRLLLKLPRKGIGIGCYFGTGIGNVVEVDGKLLAGKNGVACELGHVPVMGRHELCGCGNPGCYENYASGRYITRLCKERYPGESVYEVLTRRREDACIQEFIDNIAVVIATEINIFDPHYVILGGGVLISRGFPQQALIEALHGHVRKPYPDQGLTVYFSKNADASGVIGAALYARSQLKGGEKA